MSTINSLKASEDIDSLLDQNGDKQIPELPIDSQLYNDFSTDALQTYIGTLCANTLRKLNSYVWIDKPK